MGALLLTLVVVNAGCTGWLLSQVKQMKRTIATVAKVQRDIEDDAYPYIGRGRDLLRDADEA